jgi:cobalt/nickel transport system ATP-binding protein
MEVDENIISIKHISYSYYNKILALDDISLDIKQGGITAVIGANGSGKTTLLQVIDGLLYPDAGKIFFKDKEISKQAFKDKDFVRYFRKRVGYVFSDPDTQLFCPTVIDELAYGPVQLGLNDHDIMKRVSEIMEMLGIEALKQRSPYMLSDGEKKKIAIGSILTMNPEVLLFDEPTNGLDPRTQAFLVELILALNDAGKTIVIATHDLSLVNELHSKVAIFSENHRIEKIGEVEEILSDETLLLKVNLIHKHEHYHGTTAHTHIHSHFLFHKH